MVSNEELVKLYKSTDSKKSKDVLFKKLVNQNIGGILELVKYYNSKISINIYDDLEQEAYLSLLESIKYFKSDKGTLFWTFARTIMKQRLPKLLNECYDNKRINNISRKSIDKTSPIVLGYTDEFETGEKDEKHFFGSICEEKFDYIDDSSINTEYTKETLSKYLKQLFPEDSKAKKFYYLKNGLCNNQPQTCKNIGRLYNVSQQYVDKVCKKNNIKLKKLIDKDIESGIISLDNFI